MDKTEFKVEPNALSHIRKVIGVVSGKGGVGKSMVCSLLAVLMSRRGYETAILDADITGPSIPTAFGLKGKAVGNELGLLPMRSANDIGIMSLNLLLEEETDPVVWRGPIIANTVKQFWSEVVWGDVDVMFIDMPPGTGDVPLTVFQSLPVDGIVLVTSPQELVSMVVTKAANMAKKMDIPILALVENMAQVICPDCGKVIRVFGDVPIGGIAGRIGVDLVASLPMDPALSAACDAGKIEMFKGDWLDGVADRLESMLGEKEST
jgi:Mrp family chromosome partitioning ATPase